MAKSQPTAQNTEKNDPALAVPKPAKRKAEAKPSLLTLPVVPLKEMVVFPRMILPLFIARQQSIQALDEAVSKNSQIALFAQKREKHAYPGPADLPEIGILAQILQTLRLPDGTTRIMVECRSRLRLVRYQRKTPFLVGRFEVLEESELKLTDDQEVLTRLMMKQFESYMQLSHQLFPEAMEQVPVIEDPGALADVIAAYVNSPIPDKQAILEITDPIPRLEASGRLLSKALELASLENQIHTRVRESVDKHQKEFFLREKLTAIREELGEEGDPEIKAYKEKIALLPEGEVQEKASKELLRLEKMHASSAESGVIRTWLDTLLALPWQPEPAPDVELKHAIKVLDREHFGLTKVKDRIIEYLAVRKLAGKPPHTLLCLVGPPGVGKTSLCRSIANATGRKFERIALGGLGDDAEIRGHRRTYVGALPGRLIEAVKRAGTTHLVILLDEVDKLTRHFHGDPASALLEVLDPEQNASYRDHYLDLPFDLSSVLFICAGNVSHTIPKPLLDRMQVVSLSGYTEEEKLAIAKDYLIPRQSEECGMQNKGIALTQVALRNLIRRYTREAGVRELERKIGSLYRKLARQVVQGDAYPHRIQSLKTLHELLGPPKFVDPQADKNSEVGLVRGLAWTEIGGSVLPVEVALSPGKSKLMMTGNLGDVMKESVQIALGFVRHQSEQLQIVARTLQNHDIHVHVPEGAIPKDGPSAGIALCTALVSVLTGRAVKANLAMTGEVTLRGKVLPIGGLKEKSLAAFREGITQILIPFDNQSDLEEIPPEIRAQIQFTPVKDMSQVLEQALLPAPIIEKKPPTHRRKRV
jgi:ATP-dependent Lon protease